MNDCKHFNTKVNSRRNSRPEFFAKKFRSITLTRVHFHIVRPTMKKSTCTIVTIGCTSSKLLCTSCSEHRCTRCYTSIIYSQDDINRCWHYHMEVARTQMIPGKVFVRCWLRYGNAFSVNKKSFVCLVNTICTISRVLRTNRLKKWWSSSSLCSISMHHVVNHRKLYRMELNSKQ